MPKEEVDPRLEGIIAAFARLAGSDVPEPSTELLAGSKVAYYDWAADRALEWHSPVAFEVSYLLLRKLIALRPDMYLILQQEVSGVGLRQAALDGCEALEAFLRKNRELFV